jgi:hypothetical protein
LGHSFALHFGHRRNAASACRSTEACRGSCTAGRSGRNHGPDPREPEHAAGPSPGRTRESASIHRARETLDPTSSRRALRANIRRGTARWERRRARPWWSLGRTSPGRRSPPRRDRRPPSAAPQSSPLRNPAKMAVAVNGRHSCGT